MKERPILFSGPMVQTILSGRKTMTRRPCQGQRELSNIHDFQLDRCPYGQFGGGLWVRETARSFVGRGDTDSSFFGIEYLADGFKVGFEGLTDIQRYQYPLNKTIPSIHMPRWASRILLEITNVRVVKCKASECDNPPKSVSGDVWAWELEFRRVWCISFKRVQS